MAKNQNKSLRFAGRVAGLGITYYQRGGKTYARISTCDAPGYQSVKQFKVREQMRHAIALWNSFKNPFKPLMCERKTGGGYNAFLGANVRLPAVYLPKAWADRGAALLIDGTVVSSGRLPQVRYAFAEPGGVGRVVLTNLATGISAAVVQPLAIGSDEDLWGLLMASGLNPQLMPGDRLRFYRMEQHLRDGCPMVEVGCCEMCLQQDPRPQPWLAAWQFLSVDGFLAVGGADDENTGWAVVLYGEAEASASPQTVLTTCRLYRQFATEEALAAAAESYGNVRSRDFLTPQVRERIWN